MTELTKKKITLSWIKNLQFLAEDEHGHSIVLDTDIDGGGNNSGFRPLDLLLVSLAGCMSMDIVAIVKKKGGRISSFKMILEGERSKEHPKRFVKINYKIICQGDYKDEDLQRAFELSRDKYCSVLHTIKNPPAIEFEIGRE